MTKNESGRGDESGQSPDNGIIFDCIELLQAARDNLAALQSLTQKYNFQLVKLASNIHDWMELNDINAARQLSLTRQSVPQVGGGPHRQSGHQQLGNQRLEAASRGQEAPSQKATSKVKKEK